MEWLTIFFLLAIFALGTGALLAIDAVSGVLARFLVSLAGRLRRRSTAKEI